MPPTPRPNLKGNQTQADSNCVLLSPNNVFIYQLLTLRKVKVKDWCRSLSRTVSPSFAFSSLQQELLFSVRGCSVQRVNTEKLIFQNRILNIMHQDQFILKCMNVICIMFILSLLINHHFFFPFQKNQEGLGAVFLLVLCFWDWTVSLPLIIWWATQKIKGTLKNSLKKNKNSPTVNYVKNTKHLSASH